MKKSALLFILAGLFTLTATQAWSYESKLVNHTNYGVNYEVYVVTMSSTTQLQCTGMAASGGDKVSTCNQNH